MVVVVGASVDGGNRLMVISSLVDRVPQWMGESTGWLKTIDCTSIFVVDVIARGEPDKKTLLENCIEITRKR